LPDAEIVHSPGFENAIIKLSTALKAHVTVLKDAVALPCEAKEELAFAEEIALAEMRIAKETPHVLAADTDRHCMCRLPQKLWRDSSTELQLSCDAS
jgi:hypothetical protein